MVDVNVFCLVWQTLLSEKYGYRPLLPSIDAQEFELLLSAATDVQTRDLLNKYGFKTLMIAVLNL